MTIKPFKNSWIQTATGGLGFGVSLWALILHVQIKTGHAGDLVCDINATVNCTKIIGSEYGEFWGIPLGTFGMSFWSIVIAFSFLDKLLRENEKYIRGWQFFVGSIGAASAIVLAYVAYVVIQGVCEVCAVVQLTCLFHFLVTLVSFLKARHENTPARSTSFFRVALITAVAGVLPLSSALVASAAIASSVDKKALSSSELAGKFSGQTKNGDWYKGAITAKVELVEFTDFECPYCQVLHEKLKEVQESIGKGNLRIVFRN